MPTASTWRSVASDSDLAGQDRDPVEQGENSHPEEGVDLRQSLPVDPQQAAPCRSQIHPALYWTGQFHTVTGDGPREAKPRRVLMHVVRRQPHRVQWPSDGSQRLEVGGRQQMPLAEQTLPRDRDILANNRPDRRRTGPGIVRVEQVPFHSWCALLGRRCSAPRRPSSVL